MQLELLHIVLFTAFNLVILSTCLGSLWIMYQEKKREPRAEWASKLRESINIRFESFSAQLDTYQELRDRFKEVDEREKRHYASLSKQIRDNIELDEDEVTQTIVAVVGQHFRQLQQQMARQQPTAPPVAPQGAGADIDRPTSTLPGLRMNDAPAHG